MSVAAALAAAATVLLALWPRARPSTPTWSPRPRPLLSIGRTVRSTFGRPPDPTADRHVGVGVAIVAAVVVVDPVLPLLLVGVTLLVRRWRRVRQRRAESDDSHLVAALPDVIDLFALTVGAGYTVSNALPVVARWAPPVARPGLAATDDAIRRGALTVDALDELRARWGDPARPLLRAITDHVRHGTPLGPPLERLASDARSARRRAAETRARRLPVLLLFPLVFCTLPAFGLLTVAPIVAGTLRSLDGERLETPVSTSTNELENPPCPRISSPPRWPSCPASSTSSTAA